MGRVVCLLLAVLLLLSGCAGGSLEAATDPTVLDTVPDETLGYTDVSGYQVDSPLAYPDYTFEGTPDTNALRQTAVRAMRDLLTVQWSSVEGIYYFKTGPVSKKFFQHQPDTTYSGVIYSNASTGIFQFMEYYDQETGRLLFPGNGDAVKKVLGSSCADCLIWAWTTVCNSVTGAYYPKTMTQPNGYIPVGGYTFDRTVENYSYLPTRDICEENGTQVMLEAYTQVLPADALVSSTDDHGMMVIEDPTVVRNEDGTVNTQESYVIIQDQRGGRGDGFYEVEENGKTLLLSGRTWAKFTFQELLDKHYIPVTTEEFMGTGAYEKAQVTVTSQELTATVESNYPLAVVKAVLTDHTGDTYVLERKCFGGADEPGVPRTFDLSKLSALQELSPYEKKGYTLSIQVVVSTGERFTPIEIKL